MNDVETKEDTLDFDLNEEFGSNETAEVEGVWIHLGEEARVKVARLGNTKTQKAYRKIPKAIRRQMEDGTLGSTQTRQFMSKFLSAHILMDWDKLFDGGKALPAYTSEIGVKFLIKYRRFQERVWELSLDDDLFNVGEVEEDAGNLSKRSSGT